MPTKITSHPEVKVEVTCPQVESSSAAMQVDCIPVDAYTTGTNTTDVASKLKRAMIIDGLAKLTHHNWSKYPDVIIKVHMHTRTHVNSFFLHEQLKFMSHFICYRLTLKL